MRYGWSAGSIEMSARVVPVRVMCSSNLWEPYRKEDGKSQKEMICLDRNPIEGGDCGEWNRTLLGVGLAEMPLTLTAAKSRITKKQSVES